MTQPSELPDTRDLAEIAALIRAFADARDWHRFHTPKNLAMALAIEAGELMEPLQWLTSDEADAVSADRETMDALRSEIADVAIYLIRFADVLGIDVAEAIHAKMAINEGRFPAEEMRGKARFD